MKKGIILTVKRFRELGLKGFIKLWLRGIEGITPIQSVKTTLFSFIPIIVGMIWGILITFMAETYWLFLILIGSLPITIIQIINTYQKYKKLKLVEDTIKQLEHEQNI